MEVERQNLAEAVTLAERKHSDEKKRVDELQQQVKVLKSSLDSSKQELADYKQKATRILQVSLRCTCVNVEEASGPFLQLQSMVPCLSDSTPLYICPTAFSSVSDRPLPPSYRNPCDHA